MNWLHTATLVFHVLIAAAIVGLVLLQRGKGADAGAGFGAGASGTVFGARGSASFLSRTTATLAALFIATSLTLAYMGGRETEAPRSVIDRVQTAPPQDEQQTAPPPAPAAADQDVETPTQAPTPSDGQ
jgi:preprotein translocase subunit SecG